MNKITPEIQNILSRLQDVAFNYDVTLDKYDLQAFTDSAARFLAEGWTANEIVVYYSYSEQVGYNGTEEYAIEKMRKIFNKVRARLQNA